MGQPLFFFARKLDEIFSIFKKGGGNSSISINGKVIAEGSNPVKTTVKFFESQKLSNAEIKDYAQ